MRHGQQLQLIEKFKHECKAKGYTPSSALQVQTNNNHESEATVTRKRRNVLRWIRASFTSENGSASTIGTASQHFDQIEATDDDFGGNFHEPATLPNDYLEAICGNLTLT